MCRITSMISESRSRRIIQWESNSRITEESLILKCFERNAINIETGKNTGKLSTVGRRVVVATGQKIATELDGAMHRCIA